MPEQALQTMFISSTGVLPAFPTVHMAEGDCVVVKSGTFDSLFKGGVSEYGQSAPLFLIVFDTSYFYVAPYRSPEGQVKNYFGGVIQV